MNRSQLLVGALHVSAHLAPRVQSNTVGLLLPTSGAFPVGALAGWMLGRTVVPLNYLLKREELQYVIADCGCDTLVTVGPMLEHLGEGAADWLRRRDDGRPNGVRNVVCLEKVEFKGVPDFRIPARPEDDDLAVLLYTSGTTGRPKGVMLTHGAITANIRQVDTWVEISPKDVILGVLPQFHSFGLTVLTVLPLTIGCRVIYTARFVPTKLLRLIREHRPTVFIGIPSMYNALLHLKDATPHDFGSLRYVVSGGEPLPASVFEGFRSRFGVTINEGFGMTETAPVTNWCRPHEFRPRSVGRPLPLVRERIVDLNTGRDLPAGEEGELRIAGPNLMRGYYKRPEETARAFDERGYLRSGDIAKFDDDGHLYITGRLKEMLIVGGENVFPREIEEVLNRHPSVKESGVVGLQDPMRGELPLAFVEMKEVGPAPEEGGEPPTAAFDRTALLAWCRERLAGYKVPADIVCIKALPRTPTGKVSRKELKALAAQTPPDRG